MSHLEDRLLRRVTGARLIKWSLVGGLCGIGPILIYALIGPSDGNPIGLGLLAFVTVPLVVTGLAVGIIKWAVERFMAEGS